jgi:hypothetical protein
MAEEQFFQTYPKSNIDPRDKDILWGKKYAQAAWYDFCYTIPRTVFYNAADKYEELRLYALGKQPINKYKKLMGVDEQTNLTYLNLDWTVRPFIAQKRDIAISKMLQQGHSIICTPIDPTAKAELDKYYAQAKAKIAVKQLLQQQNPQLAQHPALQSNPGEPEDFEEMQMRIDFGEQFNRAKDAEEAIQLGFYENNLDQFEKKLYEDLFDCGIAGYKEWLGDDNKPKFRNINPEAVVTNYCRFADFRDLIHAGEVIDVSINDIAALTDSNGNALFNQDQLQDLMNNVAGKWSNPAMVGRSTNYFKGYDKFKVKVLDIEFKNYNDYNYENRIDKRGNERFNMAAWDKIDKPNTDKRKYVSRRIEVLYKIKWIIGTEYAYDFGLVQDMKRPVNNKKKGYTRMSFRFIAQSFYEMRALGMMERLMPLIDDYQLDIYKIQNISNRIVPNGWWIDLDALENVALNKGGENMKPLDLLQMFMETGVLVGRSQGVMGDNVNYKPIIPIQNSIATELQALYQKMEITMNQIQAMIGLNDVTDASTPNPKLLNGVATMMDQGTNNSLYPMIAAKKHLMTHLANDVLLRIQQGLKKGGVSGYAPALNTNTLKFIQVSDALCLRDYGIMLEEKPTDDQKQMLMQQLQFDVQNGMLDTSDAFYVMNVYNIKQAQMILAYRVKRNKQQKQQEALQNQQQTIQGQQQSAQQSAQMEQQMEQMKQQFTMAQIQLKGEFDIAVAKINNGMQAAIADQTNQVKMAGHVIAAQSKENIQKREKGMPEEQIPPIMPQQQTPDPGQAPSPGMEQNIPEEAMT